MPSTLLFCTSLKVTSPVFDVQHELVRKLQLANENCPIASPFSPALLSAADQQRPNKCVPEDYFEIFEDATDSRLRELFEERQQGNR